MTQSSSHMVTLLLLLVWMEESVITGCGNQPTTYDVIVLDDVSKPDVDVSDGERHTRAARRIRLRQLHRNRN